MRRRAVVLLSGGLDSATTLALTVREGFETYALTVRYGQRHDLEVGRAEALARALGATEHRVVELDLGFVGGSALTDRSLAVPKGRAANEIGQGIPTTYVPARNTVLLSLALAWAEVLGAERICLGANAVDYSGYPDGRPEYLQAFERLARLATRRGVEGGLVEVCAPLLRWSKGQIVREAIGLGIDLAMTLSCYDPGDDARPCGRCDACLLRAKGFAEAGASDPALE
jgi:7-cyano-7-deazaguanine synthase